MLSTSSWCFNLLCVKHLLPLLSQAHLCIPLWHLLISPLLLFLWNPISLASQYSKIYVHPPFFPSFHLVSFSPSAAALFNNPSILTSFHCFLEPCLLHNYLSFLASVSLSSLVTPLSIYPVVLQALHCKTQAHLACILFPLFNVGSFLSWMHITFKVLLQNFNSEWNYFLKIKCQLDAKGVTIVQRKSQFNWIVVFALRAVWRTLVLTQISWLSLTWKMLLVSFLAR